MIAPVMTLSYRESITALHGMLLGAGFLLAFTGCLLALWMLNPVSTTSRGQRTAARALIAGSSVMALLAWGTVLTGTFIVYPWYRATPPKGTDAVQLPHYPKALLLSDPHKRRWHELGMEWKEHVAWICPLLATAVAVVAWRSKTGLARQPQLRWALLFLLTAAFTSATVAGALGAFINKMAPTR